MKKLFTMLMSVLLVLSLSLSVLSASAAVINGDGGMVTTPDDAFQEDVTPPEADTDQVEFGKLLRVAGAY